MLLPTTIRCLSSFTSLSTVATEDIHLFSAFSANDALGSMPITSSLMVSAIPSALDIRTFNTATLWCVLRRDLNVLHCGTISSTRLIPCCSRLMLDTVALSASSASS